MNPAPHNPEHPDGGSDQTFDQLVASHQQRLYYFIRAMIYSPDDARDTLQDVNIIIYRKQPSYEMGTNFKAWAFAIARFECLSYLSRYKKAQMTTLDADLLETLADKAEEKAEQAERRVAMGLPAKAQDKGILDAVPAAMPAPIEALKLQQKAAKVGFD